MSDVKKRFAVVIGIPVAVFILHIIFMMPFLGAAAILIAPLFVAFEALLFFMANMMLSDIFFYCLHGRKKTYRDDGMTCLDHYINYKSGKVSE